VILHPVNQRIVLVELSVSETSGQFRSNGVTRNSKKSDSPGEDDQQGGVRSIMKTEANR
jgi:hypothetical protein